MNTISDLNKLKALLDSGAIDQTEYESLKKKIIYSSDDINGNIEDKHVSSSSNNKGYNPVLYRITYFVTGILLLVFMFRYEKPTVFIFTLVLAPLAIFIISRLKIRNYYKNALFISAIVLYLILIMLPIGSTIDYTSKNSSEQGIDKYCTKHNRAYNTNNAWKGCPECIEEEWDKKVEESRQRLLKNNN